MKKGQLLSQPFFYIFAIIVIGLILIFGFKYVGKILEASCEVENLDLVNDVRSQVNQLRALSFGSSYECAFDTASTGERRCEFVVPKNVKGICFVDTTRGQFENIEFTDIKELVSELGATANRNMFFSAEESSCRIEPVMIKNVEIQSPVCIDTTKENRFIMENSGNLVEIKK